MNHCRFIPRDGPGKKGFQKDSSSDMTLKKLLR